MPSPDSITTLPPGALQVVQDDARLAALRDLDLLDTGPEERFDRVTRLCQRLFGVPMAYVNLVDRDRQFTKSSASGPLPDLPINVSFCARAIETPDAMVIADLTADARFSALPLVEQDPHLRFYAGVPLQASGGQRIGTLCIADTSPRDLSSSDQDLLEDLALWVEKELNLDAELDRAAEVQRALLPVAAPADTSWDVAATCVPCRAVGGDFYDWFPTRRGTVVTLGDVMGKGMPAAIVMATVRSALRAGGHASALEDGLEGASAALSDDLLATQSFATVLQARLGADGTLSVVDAGHGHGVILREDGSVTPLGRRGLPLGLDMGVGYGSDTYSLAPGDRLIAFSDGLVELPDGPRDAVEVARLIDDADADGAAAAVAQVLSRVALHAAEDDVTVLVARWCG